MKHPDGIDAYFIPMEFDDFPALQDQREKRNEYWRRLKLAKEEFLKKPNTDYFVYPTNAFVRFLKETYGLDIVLIDGNIGEDYNIIDEKKYTLFLLRYT